MKFLFFINLFFACSFLQAQHDHSSEESEHKKVDPPHGGVVVEAGKYHIELKLDPLASEEKLLVWILDSRYKVRHPKNSTLLVKFKYKNGEVIETNMTSSSDRFHCNVPDVSLPFNAFLILTVNNKTYEASCYFKGLGK